MKKNEFETMFKALTEAQKALISARETIAELKKERDFLVFLRKEELDKVQKLINEDTVYDVGDLMQIYGNAVHGPVSEDKKDE
jgi:transcriptional/translational regulatory protein YebC/TACO1